MAIEKEIGSRIKRLRKMRKCSQEALSALAGLDRGYISEIENGHKNFSIQTLKKIADALNVKLTDLVSD